MYRVCVCVCVFVRVSMCIHVRVCVWCIEEREGGSERDGEDSRG